MVLMLRSLGIPARNVTGYYGGELTDAGYYAVRAGDAHSWVEVYFPGAGWSRFDPTPPGSRGSQQDSLWAHMVLLWDTLQERWRALVVDYDLISQGNAVRRMGELINEAGRRLGGKAGAAPRLRVIVLGLLIGAAAGLLAVALRRVSWRASFGMGGGRPAALEADRRRAMQLWRRAKQQMQRAGCEVRESTTAAEAARLCALPQADELVAAYLAARWGNAPMSPARARSLLRQLDAALAGRGARA